MAYVAVNYATNPAAPLKSWVCTRTSTLGPFTEKPTSNTTAPNFCGQCVSYVTTACPSLPVAVGLWKKGELAKGNKKIVRGTVIATFDKTGQYSGHAAIYESQDYTGLNVVDQWVTGAGSPIHRRLLRFGAHGNSNNGDNFYVVE